jgi:intein/homing endonuclease
MNFDLSKIEFSNKDRNIGIVLPEKMSAEFAEFLGIMVGDGHIGHYGHHRQIVITGNIRDRNYYEDYVNNLIFTLFNIKFNIFFQKSRNAVMLNKHSKALFSFLTKVIKLPAPRKNNITIPSCILNSSKEIKIAFLRGLADADFCLTIKHKPNKYPVIHGTAKSSILIKQCSEILQQLGIQNTVGTEITYCAKRNKTYISQRVYVNGFFRVSKFMDLIGFKTDYKINKYEEIIGGKHTSA